MVVGIELRVNDIKKSEAWKEREREQAKKAMEEFLKGSDIEVSDLLVRTCLQKIRKHLTRLVFSPNFKGLYKYYFLAKELITYLDSVDRDYRLDSLRELLTSMVSLLDKLKINE